MLDFDTLSLITITLVFASVLIAGFVICIRKMDQNYDTIHFSGSMLSLPPESFLSIEDELQ